MDKHSGRHYILLVEDSNPTDILSNVGKRLESLSASKVLANYFARILHTEDDIEDEMLESSEVLNISEGKLPVVFVNVAYATGETLHQDIQTMEQDFTMKLIKVFSIN